MEKKSNVKWVIIAVVLVILLFFAFIFAGIVALFSGLSEAERIGTGNVALIHINGLILTEGGGGFFDEDVVSSTKIKLDIEDAYADPTIKAIIFEINSPGGSAVASEEIANAIKKVDKTTVALIRETGASGGYWVASATDYIIANRMSVTGSIGVIASYLDFSGLIKDYNVTYERLVSGKYKDMGVPFRELTPTERILFQKKLDLIHEYFIEEVAKNRGLTNEQVNDLATGIFYLGSEAKELGLVDELGGEEEAIAYLEKELNITVEIVEYVEKPSFFDILAGTLNEKSFFVGKGIGSVLTEKKANKLEVW